MNDILNNVPSMKIEDMQKDSRVISEYLNDQFVDSFSFNLVDNEDDIIQNQKVPSMILINLYCLFCILLLPCFFSVYDSLKIIIFCSVMYFMPLILLQSLSDM